MRRQLPCLLVALLAVLVAVAADPPVKAKPAKGTSYAFLVGCAGYDRAELQPVKDDVTVNDVVEFKKTLLATGFAEENVVLMHDQRTDQRGRFLPEYAKIVKELDLLLDGMTKDDTVVVVLSGHGVHFKGDKFGYFCPIDAKVSAKKNLLPMDGEGGLYPLLEKCKAGRKLLIANACRNDPASGATLAGGKVELTDDYPETVPQGVAAIYSCDVGQKSYFDTDRKRSLFFLHLTDAWKGKGDVEVNLEDVFEQTRVKTKADASKTFGEKQFPVVRRGYEGAWTVVPGKADPYRNRPRVGFSDEQKKHLKVLLDAGQKELPDLKFDDERMEAYAVLGTLAHFTGDDKTAGELFDNAVKIALNDKTDTRGNNWTESLQKLLSTLAWCDRVPMINDLERKLAKVGWGDDWVRRDRWRASGVISGIARRGSYPDARKWIDTTDRPEVKDGEHLALFRSAWAFGDFEAARASGEQFVQSSSKDYYFLHTVTARGAVRLYHDSGNGQPLPPDFVAKVTQARGDDDFHAEMLKLAAGMSDQERVYNAIEYLGGKSEPERKLMRDKLPLMMKHVAAMKAEDRTNGYVQCLYTAVAAGDDETAAVLLERVREGYSGKDRPRFGSYKESYVVEAWADRGEFAKVKQFLEIVGRNNSDSYQLELSWAEVTRLFRAGDKAAGLEKLTALKKTTGSGFEKVYAAAVKAKASDELLKWLFAKPFAYDGNDIDSWWKLSSHLAVAHAAVEVGRPEDAIACLKNIRTEKLSDFQFYDIANGYILAGRIEDGVKVLPTKPVKRSNEYSFIDSGIQPLVGAGLLRETVEHVLARRGEFSYKAAMRVVEEGYFRNQLEEQLNKAKR